METVHCTTVYSCTLLDLAIARTDVHPRKLPHIMILHGGQGAIIVIPCGTMRIFIWKQYQI